jgi:hypothetical protein
MKNPSHVSGELSCFFVMPSFVIWVVPMLASGSVIVDPEVFQFRIRGLSGVSRTLSQGALTTLTSTVNVKNRRNEPNIHVQG